MKQKSISKTVEEILEFKPFIKESFIIGAVNYSGLARHLLPILKENLGKKKINPEAVIMAIKRYSEKVNKESISKKLLSVLTKYDLMLKGDIVDFTLRRNPHNYKTVLWAHEKIKWEEGDIISINQTINEIAVILDKKNEDLILKKVDKSEIINKERNLAMITLRTPPEILGIPGMFHYLLGLIASEGIVLTDVISTYTGLIIIIKEKDGAKAYETLFRAIKKARELKKR